MNALEFVLVTTVVTACISAVVMVAASMLDAQGVFDAAYTTFCAAFALLLLWMALVVTILLYAIGTT